MPSSPDSTPAVSTLPLRSILLIIGMTAAGFSLTLYVFYPGVMTYDAHYVYDDIAKGTFGDWQSPVMTLLWSLIDPIAPGSASMFLLTATLYWLTFALLAFTIGRISIWRRWRCFYWRRRHRPLPMSASSGAMFRSRLPGCWGRRSPSPLPAAAPDCACRFAP